MKQLSDFSTYRTGILQARAYRNLRRFMEAALVNEDLTSAEWSILGVVNEETTTGGIRVGEVATLLDVETSFVTNMVKKLLKNGYVEYAYDADDGRVRLIMTTKEGSKKARELELAMRAKMNDWLGNVQPNELVRYINVLEKLSRKTDVDS